jgi:trehalose synthase
MIEHLGLPSSARRMRALEAARERAADELGGRIVWCATALPAHRASAQRLRASLQWGGGVATDLLEVAADDELRALADRLDAMLDGASSSRPGAADGEICARRVRESEELLGAVGPDDVVVFHDVPSALLVHAVRDRRAHAVWHVHVAAASQGPMAEAVRAFLRRYTPGIDAYVTTWAPADHRGAPVERIAALMPSADVVATKEIPLPFASGEPRQLGWSSVLADVVHTDRDETVGGTRHPRPTVAVR